MRTHKIELPFEVAPELIYERKNFLIIDSQKTGINEMAFGDQISVGFLQKANHTEIQRIETGDFMIVEVQYIEVINETMIVVAIKPKSYHANTFSVMY